MSVTWSSLLLNTGCRGFKAIVNHPDYGVSPFGFTRKGQHVYAVDNSLLAITTGIEDALTLKPLSVALVQTGVTQK